MFSSWKLIALLFVVAVLAVLGLRWQAGIAAVARMEAAQDRARLRTIRDKMKDEKDVETISDDDLADAITRRR